MRCCSAIDRFPYWMYKLHRHRAHVSALLRRRGACHAAAGDHAIGSTGRGCDPPVGMTAEARAFARELIARDLPITAILRLPNARAAKVGLAPLTCEERTSSSTSRARATFWPRNQPGAFLAFSAVDGNHHAGQCFLTGAPHTGQPTFRNSLSLDQLAAEHIGLDTRFPSLAAASAMPTRTATTTCRLFSPAADLKHGGHPAFDECHNSPLANLFVTMLQGLGIEADRFASSTGTISGLELRS